MPNATAHVANGTLWPISTSRSAELLLRNTIAAQSCQPQSGPSPTMAFKRPYFHVTPGAKDWEIRSQITNAP